MGKKMKDQTGLVRRAGSTSYYFRARIPPDLREHFGKAEVFVSVGTSDRQLAIQRVRLRRLALDQEISQARKQNAPVVLADLSPEEIERLSTLYYANALADDEYLRSTGRLQHDNMFDLYGKAVEHFGNKSAQLVARGVTGADVATEGFLKTFGLKIQPETPLYKRVSYALAKAEKQASDAILQRQQGSVIDTPKEPGFSLGIIGNSDGSDTLPSLVAYWKTQGSKSFRSIQEVEHASSLLENLFPNIPASKITREHIIAYKDARLSSGKADSTVRKELNLLRAVFQTALDNQKFSQGAVNPVLGVKLPSSRGVEGEKRNPFSLSDLQAIFASEVYKSGFRPTGGAGEAAFWIPLIGLWSGARLDEIGQLDCSDIKEEMGGWYFHILHDPSKGRRVKAKKSRRVSVHPVLLRCGLLKYVKDIQESGQIKLFPLLSSKQDRQITASWSQWFGRYLRQAVGIKETDKVFHSFRHTFKDAWRECLLPEDISDAITGHSNPSIGRRYGGSLYPLRPMHEAMAKFNYEGLDLSFLFAR